MNDSAQNSQGLNIPTTKSQQLFSIISCSRLLVTAAAVTANLSQLTDVHEAIRAGKLNEDTVNAVLALTEQHLWAIDGCMDSAISIYCSIDFQHCKKLVNDIILVIQSFQFCTLNLDGKGDFLHGLFLSSLKLSDSIDLLERVVADNKERING